MKYVLLLGAHLFRRVWDSNLGYIFICLVVGSLYATLLIINYASGHCSTPNKTAYSEYTEVCIDGVTYIKTSTSITVKFDQAGDPYLCKEVP